MLENVNLPKKTVKYKLEKYSIHSNGHYFVNHDLYD